MAAKAEEVFNFDIPTSSVPIVIVGAGPVGMHAANEIIRRDKGRNLVIFGDEPREPCNRVKLSSLLAGDIRLPGLSIKLIGACDNRVWQFYNSAMSPVTITEYNSIQG
ncbi:MAG: hypothetical protein GXP08_01595 [Gammaproteobacteria bacterium]|nr:hypothetical protein [Gammaproteobacteria bacterium]